MMKGMKRVKLFSKVDPNISIITGMIRRIGIEGWVIIIVDC